MGGQLPNEKQAIRLLQWAYQISYWEAAKIHYGDRAVWWIQAGHVVGVETDTREYKELEPEPVQEGNNDI